MSAHAPSAKFWTIAALTGAAIGAIVGGNFPLSPTGPTPLWLCIPFAALLLSIAIAPLVLPRVWHAHYPSVALFLGGLILGHQIAALGGLKGPGAQHMLHAAIEFYQFIALVGGLYVASGGIVISIRGPATPLRNALLLAIGAVLANILGTTGASVLLIRPYMRMNPGRLHAFHVVMFIFIVSNCGGALTPIGDPPLYLGFLKGVPFTWTITHLWPMWLFVNGLLLTILVIFDACQTRPVRAAFDEAPGTPLFSGIPSAICLLALVAGVFIDPALKHLNPTFAHYPIGATFQIAMAGAAYLLSTPAAHKVNQFSFEPVKEVGFLFAGIFLTMVPALDCLRGNAHALGLDSPTLFYFFTGALSAVLDNAPTYLSFLQTALGASDLPMDPQGIQQFVTRAGGAPTLEAISLGAVFFGAMTYIGNGPNFMVRAIVESTHAAANHPDSDIAHHGLGTRTPSFGGYLLYALAILLPVLILNWLIFIR